MLNYQRVKDRFEPQIMINPKGLVERVPFRANGQFQMSPHNPYRPGTRDFYDIGDSRCSIDHEGRGTRAKMVSSHNNNTLWLFNMAMENPFKKEVLLGKSSINGPFSIAMLNYQSG